MRGLYFGLAVLFCVVALILNVVDVAAILGIIAIVVAGIFLVLGLRVTAARREPARVELDAEQEQTIRAMVAEGRDSAAINQVQLWFRGVTPEQARTAVAALRGTAR
ncbi:hypothetical protein [Corynebacterium halotolerans]|uniref:hypothetical protein n=1 Tax=Corynebacterium halotolerans TaxID=225326 RepID=UPI003CF8BE2C